MIKPNKIITIIFVILTPLLLPAQNSEHKINRKLSIGISFSPDYAYRNLYLENDEYDFVGGRNESEKPRFGYTTGLVAKYQFRRRLAIESGIQFSDKGFKIKGTIEDFVTSEGTTPYNDPSIPDKYKFDYCFYNIGIPVKLNYYFLQKKVGLFVSGGFSSDFFLSGKTKYKLEFRDRTEKNSYSADENFNKINFTGIAGVGLKTMISQKLHLQFEPVLRYTFTPLFNTDLKQYQYSIGANATLFWGF